MPRLGSDSNSSVRRHNPTQTLSNYFQVNSQVWQIRTSGPSRQDSQPRADSSPVQPEPLSDPQLDVLDDILTRTRASASRTRWNARPFGSPYGPRPLHKWLPSEQKHFEELSALMEMFPEPGSDDEYEEEKDLHEIVAEEMLDEGDDDDEDAGEGDMEDDEEDESDPEEAVIPGPSTLPHPSGQPQSSAAAAKKREKNKKKKAKARAKAKEKMNAPPTPDSLRDPPQDLLASMSRIAQLVGSLNADTPEGSTDLLQRVRDAFTEEGRQKLATLKMSTEPAQWRAEVLQSVRRMESMLGQMEKWQAQVAPGEIEALRAETARLEVRVRAVVEQKEKERAEIHVTAHRQLASSPPAVSLKTEDQAEVEVAEAAVSSDGEEPVVLDGGGLFQAGASEREDDDADSVSDSALESSSCPSNETGPTEPELDNHLLQDNKDPDAGSPSKPDPPRSPVSVAPAPPPMPVTTVIHPPYDRPPGSSHTSTTPTAVPQSAVPQLDLPRPAAATTAPLPSFTSLSPTNLNVPPEPPTDPVVHLKRNPWTMIEVLFLLEVVSHFPPAEHGWVFIAEAYNNILITRPLQEWFGKQATSSNEEEAKMKIVLQKMHAEARQLRARRAQDAATAARGSEAGERGKAAPFGSAEARAEANARAKHPANAASLDKDALIVTRLPYPISLAPGATAHAADNPATPPPAQRIVPFPRRRPPLSLPSDDARSFARVMASAVAGVRPPSTESRAAMLTLYSATKSRFPVRTAWDCWHRWCTPWVVQNHADVASDEPPLVLDYITGNICLPAGTWVTQARGFVYRPVPGTYPDAPGVQRKVTAEFDPRPGMVVYARMAHLYAERAWAAMGLKRRPDGTVSEEVLIGRRAKLPGTLVGIWPGKVRPAKEVRAAAQAAAKPPSAKPPPAAASPTPEGAGKKVRFASPPAKSANSGATPAPTAASISAAAANITVAPVPTFVPLPQPRKPPSVELPNVPEGTFGSRVRPGMATWFQHAALRVSVLERITDLKHAREQFERALGGSSRENRSTTRQGEVKDEPGKALPPHLRDMAIPPPPTLRVELFSRSPSGAPEGMSAAAS
ncbi:hypothetical protein BV20DRAFT_1095284 [Pilatotrama ljubarskyi]|nr:hypothetical protein BV20DRAFT_1095284 [Pilatotrama ljubarskyi]